MALNLVDFDDVKNLLGLSKAESNYPALEVLEKGVTAAVQEYLGRELELKERTEEIDVLEYTQMVSLKGLPVASISSIQVQTLGITGVEDIDSTDWMITSYGVMLARQVMPPSKITVVYTGGYTNRNIPDGIRQPATTQIAYEWQNKDFIGAQRVSSEGGSKDVPALQLLKEVKRRLDKHRHPMRVFVG